MSKAHERTMKCPTCTEIALVMTERKGVEIDYCPQCRGVWLARGELDKLIEHPAAMAAATGGNAPASSRPDFADSDYDHGHAGRRPSAGQRKRSWLHDIFD